MTDELLNALLLIKKECEKHNRCKQCPFVKSNDECGIINRSPHDWKLKRREIWF